MPAAPAATPEKPSAPATSETRAKIIAYFSMGFSEMVAARNTVGMPAKVSPATRRARRMRSAAVVGRVAPFYTASWSPHRRMDVLRDRTPAAFRHCCRLRPSHGFATVRRAAIWSVPWAVSGLLPFRSAALTASKARFDRDLTGPPLREACPPGASFGLRSHRCAIATWPACRHRAVARRAYSPAASLRAAALSTRSHVNSGSSRPKWP